jgi:hypothetical protein
MKAINGLGVKILMFSLNRSVPQNDQPLVHDSPTIDQMIHKFLIGFLLIQSDSYWKINARFKALVFGTQVTTTQSREDSDDQVTAQYH